MKNKYILALLIMGLMLSIQTSPVNAVVLDENTCIMGTGIWGGSGSLSWSNSPSTCTVTGFVSLTGELNISFGTNLDLINGYIDGYFGVINNYGTINNNAGGTFGAFGTFNAGSIINNNAGGTFNAAGTFNAGSIINNNAGGNFNAFSTFNAGSIVNNNAGGTITSEVSTFNAGTLINNDGTIKVFILNTSGIINNNGTITNVSDSPGMININASGTINNYNTITSLGLININAGGSINNYNTIDQTGFFNTGIINNMDGGTIGDFGSIVNEVGGTIYNNNRSTIYLESIVNAGDIINNGTFLIRGLLNDNYGTITNNGFIKNFVEFHNNPDGMIYNNLEGKIENSLSVPEGSQIENDGTISNIGLIQNNKKIVNNPGATINNLGTINNGGWIFNYGTINCTTGTIYNVGTINNKCGGIFHGSPLPNSIQQETPCTTTTVPEFPTIALPIASVIGLMFFISRRNKQ